MANKLIPQLTDDGFVAYLKDLGYSPFTVKRYPRRVAFVAAWLRYHRRWRRLSRITRHCIPTLLKECLVGRAKQTHFQYRKALFRWLRYQGRFIPPARRTQWRPWLEDYLNFLQIHRGVRTSTIEHSAADVEAFLRWRFGRGAAEWSVVTRDGSKLGQGARTRGSDADGEGVLVAGVGGGVRSCRTRTSATAAHRRRAGHEERGEGFRQILASAGVEIVLCPPRVPQCNAFAERFVRSIKKESLSRLIFLSENHLRTTVSIVTKYYQHRRNHQGIVNQLITPSERLPTAYRIRCPQELGGMLNYYYREAA